MVKKRPINCFECGMWEIRSYNLCAGCRWLLDSYDEPTGGKMKIGDEVYVRGIVDEIRLDKAIIRNDYGYFGTAQSEIVEKSEIEKKADVLQLVREARSVMWEKTKKYLNNNTCEERPTLNPNSTAGAKYDALTRMVKELGRAIEILEEMKRAGDL